MKRKLGWFGAGYFLLACFLGVFSRAQCPLPEAIAVGVHTDYRFEFFQSVPRSYTSRCFVSPPILILGNQEHWARDRAGVIGPKPIPRKGEWQLSLVQWRQGWPVILPYFALTTIGGWHFRIGPRWDDIDHYYTFPSFAIKQTQ